MKIKLKNLISEGKTKQALDLLLKTTKDAELHHKVILLSARYKDYEEEKHSGISSYDNEKISLSKVNDSLLSIIDQLEDSKVLSSSTKALLSTNTKYSPSKIIGFTIIAVLIGLAYYSSQHFFVNKTASSFAVTVLVHGKSGKDDIILKNQGEVVLDIGGDRKTETIDIDGEATFKELPIGYIGKKVLVSISHHQPYFPTQRNAEYELKPNQVIYLEVVLKGMDLIKGTIIDFQTEMPLDSVRVSVQDIAAYTNNFGWFELEIPEEKQAKSIQVSFFKEGYQMGHLNDVYPHTREGIELALKRYKK